MKTEDALARAIEALRAIKDEDSFGDAVRLADDALAQLEADERHESPYTRDVRDAICTGKLTEREAVARCAARRVGHAVARRWRANAERDPWDALPMWLQGVLETEAPD